MHAVPEPLTVSPVSAAHGLSIFVVPSAIYIGDRALARVERLDVFVEEGGIEIPVFVWTHRIE
jgi:hypothetical protein